VTFQSRACVRQPVDGKNDVSINHRDEPAARRCDSRASGVTSAAVLWQLDDLNAGVTQSNINDYLRGAVARTIIYYDDLMFWQTLEFGNCGKRTRDIISLVICNYDEADQELL
jgi:hypothetical protein